MQPVTPRRTFMTGHCDKEADTGTEHSSAPCPPVSTFPDLLTSRPVRRSQSRPARDQLRPVRRAWPWRRASRYAGGRLSAAACSVWPRSGFCGTCCQSYLPPCYCYPFSCLSPDFLFCGCLPEGVDDLFGDLRPLLSAATLGVDDGNEFLHRLLQFVIDDQLIEPAVLIEFMAGILQSQFEVSLTVRAARLKPLDQCLIRGRQDENADGVRECKAGVFRPLHVNHQNHV